MRIAMTAGWQHSGHSLLVPMTSAPCDTLRLANDHAAAATCYSALGSRATAVDLFHAAASSRAADDLPKATDLYRSAIRTNPNLAEAYMNLAWILSETDHTEDAVDAYAHGLRMKQWPAATAAGAHNNRGACLKRLGQKEEAAASFHAALAVLPGFDAAENNLRDLSSRGSFAEFIQ